MQINKYIYIFFNVIFCDTPTPCKCMIKELVAGRFEQPTSGCIYNFFLTCVGFSYILMS